MIIQKIIHKYNNGDILIYTNVGKKELINHIIFNIGNYIKIESVGFKNLYYFKIDDRLYGLPENILDENFNLHNEKNIDVLKEFERRYTNLEIRPGDVCIKKNTKERYCVISGGGIGSPNNTTVMMHKTKYIENPSKYTGISCGKSISSDDFLKEFISEEEFINLRNEKIEKILKENNGHQKRFNV